MAAFISETYQQTWSSSTSPSLDRFLQLNSGRLCCYPCLVRNGSRRRTFRTFQRQQKLRIRGRSRDHPRPAVCLSSPQSGGGRAGGEYEGGGGGGVSAHCIEAPSNETPVVVRPKWFSWLLEDISLRWVVLDAPTWIRSTAIFAGVFFVLGVRAAAGAQNPVLPKPLPVFTHVSSVSDNSRVPSAVGNAESRHASDSVQRNAGSVEQAEGEGEASKSDENSSVSASKESRELSVSQTSSSRSDSADRQGGDAELMEDYEEDSDEDYEEEEDECDEIDDFIMDVDNDERIQGAAMDFSEPQTSVKVDTQSATTGDNTERMGVEANIEEDKELEKAFEEWRSTPYKLTVPLRVVGLRGSVPPVWLKDFILSQGRRARITVEYQGGLKDILSELAATLEKKRVKPRSIMAADIVTVGDSWLRIAVSGGLIEPIENAEHYDWFKSLSPKWQALLRRDDEGRLNSQGLIWGVPYRWGSMVIAYKKDKLAKNNIPPIKDWKDLWRPELAGKIAMVDSPREVVGAVLKSLGASYNTQDFEKEVQGGKEAVKHQFLALRKQVRLFDSIQYLKALGAGDVWVAVGWSSDVIPVAKRMSNIGVATPESGTSLWADLWAIPAATCIPSDKIGGRVRGPSPLIHQWFDFCLQPARASPFRQGVFVGASPLYLSQGVKYSIVPQPTQGTLTQEHQIMVDGEGDEKASINLSEVQTASDTLEETMADGLIKKGGPRFDTNFVEGMPPKEITAKSEFLEPLSDKAVADYEWLFSESVEGRGWPSSMSENIKQSFQGSFGLKSQRG